MMGRWSAFGGLQFGSVLQAMIGLCGVMVCQKLSGHVQFWLGVSKVGRPGGRAWIISNSVRRSRRGSSSAGGLSRW